MTGTVFIAPLASTGSSAALTLLDAGAKGVAVLLAAAVVNALVLRRRSAACRHAVWGAAMAALLILPVVSACVPGRPWAVLPLATEPVVAARAPVAFDPAASLEATPPAPSAGDLQQAQSGPTPPTDSPAPDGPAAPGEGAGAEANAPPPAPARAAPMATRPRPTPISRAVTPPSNAERHWAALACTAWAVGAAGCLLLLAVDLLALRWLARRGAQITRGPWLETFEQVRPSTGGRPVILLELPGTGMPVACGVLAPTLVLPRDAAAWPPERRRAVLQHELAHVRRRDCATQLMARVACAVHWFNPLAWFAMRQMRVERERACDDAVVRTGRAAPAEYASHLLEIARSLRAARFGALAGVAMARPSQLEGRLLAVLNDRNDHRPVGRSFVLSGILTALLAVGALAAVRVAPREPGAANATGASHATALDDAAPSAVRPAADARAPAPTSAPAAQARTFPNGQQVEVKWGGLWRKAVVVNHRGEWVLIDYDGKRFFREWVEPWRVRAVGSAYDIDGSAPINPSVHHNEDPPRDKPGPAPEHRAAPAAGSRAAEPLMEVPVTPVARDDAKVVPVQGLPPLSGLPPDAATPVAAAHAAIQLKGSTGEFFDNPAALLLSPASGTAAVVHRDAPPGNKSPDVRVERVDLKTGKSLNVASLAIDLEAYDLSPDGTLLLGRVGVFGPGHGGRLDVWRVDGDKAAHVVTFLPFTERTGGEQVVWARFVDADHLLARSFDGELSCYAFRTGVQVWSAKLVAGGASAMSANRKYVAASTQGAIVILDALTGGALGQIELGDHPASSLAFKPDGRQIAAAGPDALAIWELSSGSVAADVSAVGAAGQTVDWGEEGYLLLDHAHLVAPAKQAVVWTYRGVGTSMQGSLAAMLDGRLFYTAEAAPNAKPKRPVIASTAIPDVGVKGTLAVVGNLKMVVMPGATVSLDVSCDGSIQQPVIDALTARLKANGATVADGQAVKLVARDEPGETREVSYRMIGPGAFGRTEKISVQEIKHTIEVLGADGKPLWKRGGVTAPPIFISLKQGQSAQEAVAEQMKPSPKFYAGTRVPKYIPKTAGGFGASDLTAAGAAPALRNPRGA